MPRDASVPIWWHAHYHFHPDKVLNPANASLSGNKWKIYCKACFEEHMADIVKRNEAAGPAGVSGTPRDIPSIKSYLWNMKAAPAPSSLGYRRSALDTLARHLISCRYTTQTVKQEAEYHLKNSKREASSSQQSSQSATPLLLTPLVIPGSQLPAEISPYPQSALAYSPHPWPLAMNAPTPSQGYSALPGASPLPVLLDFSSTHVSPPLRPEDSISSVSSRSGARSAPPALTSTLMQFNSNYNSSQIAYGWSPERQRLFETRIARLTSSAGLPLAWVDNPEWALFCEEYIPMARSPSRKTLTNRIIPSLVDQLRNNARSETQGSYSTLQADGWTGVNHRHLIAFMITANKKVYTIKVHDASMERKNGKNLQALLEEAITEVESKWGSQIVAVVTDASGECRRARKDLKAKFPWLIVLDCYSHQINLVVADYFKADSEIFKHTDKAGDLITWLRSKVIVLALLRENQLKTSGKTLAILRAILTRWTAHLRAYERLLLTQKNLVAIVYEDEARDSDSKLIVTGDAKAKTKSREMCEIIKDSSFWHALARAVRHLRPLGIAANVIQASHCGLYTVILTFGYLVLQYMSMTDPEDFPGRDAIIASLEKRWSKADQEVFIAAVIVNPFYRMQPFAKIAQFTNSRIVMLMERLWIRFNHKSDSSGSRATTETTPPSEFFQQLLDFIDPSANGAQNTFFGLDKFCALERIRAEENRETVDPTRILDNFKIGDKDSVFITFARKLLSISANSASCERLFSTYGGILDKYRNRLLLKNLMNNAELKMHTRDEHLRNKAVRMSTKNRFETRSKIAMLEASNRPTASDSTSTIATETRGPQTSTTRSTLSSSMGAETLAPESDVMEDPTPEVEHIATLRGIIAIEMQRLDLDDDTPWETPSDRNLHPRVPSQSNWIPMSLTDIFDFDNTHWKTIFEGHALRTFDEELEIYQLLDLDAEGEEDVDIDVDEITAQTLLGS